MSLSGRDHRRPGRGVRHGHAREQFHDRTVHGHAVFAVQHLAAEKADPVSYTHLDVYKRQLYNTGTRLGLIYELRLRQCYLMPDEIALRELSECVIEKLKLLTDAEFAELEFPPD